MEMEINEKDFSEKIKGTCVVDFFATWCPPCKMLAPVFAKVSEEYGNKLGFYKVNIDENNNIANKYGITHVPTLVLFKNGSPINKTSGFMDEKELIKFISQVV